MKKIFICISVLSICLLLCGCNGKRKVEGTPMPINEFGEIVMTGAPADVENAVKKVEDINQKIQISSFGHLSEPVNVAYVAATYTKYPEVIDILAKNGADLNPDIKDPSGCIFGLPNHAASINPNYGIITALIKNGAKSNSCGNKDYGQLVLETMTNQNTELLKEVLSIKKVHRAAMEYNKRTHGLYSDGAKYASSPERGKRYKEILQEFELFDIK